MQSVISSVFQTDSHYQSCMTGLLSSRAYEVQTNELQLPCPGSGIYRSATHGILEYVSLPDANVTASYHSVAERPVGNLIFVPPGAALHWHWSVGCQRAVMLAFDTRQLAGLTSLTFDWSQVNLSDTFDIGSPYLISMMEELSDEASARGVGSEIKADGIVTLLALELRRKFMPAMRQEFWQANAHTQPDTLAQLRSYIAADAEPDFTVQNLARICKMSPRALSSFLLQSTGMTARSFAAAARLERAKLLLVREDGLIKEVAYRCGFKGPAAFGWAFRKAVGMTPQAYRLAHGFST